MSIGSSRFRFTVFSSYFLAPSFRFFTGGGNSFERLGRRQSPPDKIVDNAWCICYTYAARSNQAHTGLIPSQGLRLSKNGRWTMIVPGKERAIRMGRHDRSGMPPYSHPHPNIYLHPFRKGSILPGLLNTIKIRSRVEAVFEAIRAGFQDEATGRGESGCRRG